MATSETPRTNIDLECGRRSSVDAGGEEEEEEEESVCFSDADEGSCNSQFYSTADGDGSFDDFSFACGSEILEDEGLRSRRDSSVGDSSDDDDYDDDLSVDLENGEKGLNLGMLERDCRICHLSLVSSSPGCGVAIELGCCCKDDLAAAHKHCAETWFKIKGNKTCEICNSIASNVIGPIDVEAAHEENEDGVITTSSVPAVSNAQTRSCLNGHRFLNFLLACMVFAFVISWLFHFNIPS